MSDINQLIEQIVTGENAAAKDTFDAMISERALGYLEEYKKQMASSIFGEAKKEDEKESDSEEGEDDEDEDEDEEEDKKEDKKVVKEDINPRSAILNKVRARIGM